MLTNILELYIMMITFATAKTKCLTYDQIQIEEDKEHAQILFDNWN